MTQPGPTRNAPPVVTALLALLAVVLIVLGVVYFVDSAAHLPAFLPGHQAGSTHHHTKHGFVAVLLGVIAAAGAWMSAGTKAPRD